MKTPCTHTRHEEPPRLAVEGGPQHPGPTQFVTAANRRPRAAAPPLNLGHIGREATARTKHNLVLTNKLKIVSDIYLCIFLKNATASYAAEVPVNFSIAAPCRKKDQDSRGIWPHPKGPVLDRRNRSASKEARLSVWSRRSFLSVCYRRVSRFSCRNRCCLRNRFDCLSALGRR